MNDKQSLEFLILVKNLNDYDDQSALDHVAQLIDAGLEEGSESALTLALEFIENIWTRSLSHECEAELYYFLSNCWGGLERIRSQESNAPVGWESIEKGNEIVNLRKSIKSKGFELLPQARKIQILTNLANNLSNVGRPIEAIRVFDCAFEIFKDYGMAQGGKGICLKSYAGHIYDEGYSYILFHEAFNLLEQASLSLTCERHAQPIFQKYAELLRPEFSDAPKFNDIESSSFIHEELIYREWCLEQRLFINPLNDLCRSEYASRDVFGLPSLITTGKTGGEIPKYFGYYNILKQEYVSARYLFFEGVHSNEVHFSDRDVLIYNTLDYSLHSLSIEKIKLAYRAAYSILDKVSFFIRDYFEISIPEHRTYFKTIWYENAEKKKGISKKFLDSKNWGLQGLFWLSKDLFDSDPEFRENIEPDAERLHQIRNYLEHRMFGIYHCGMNEFEEDNLKLSDIELIAKTKKIFRIARESLIYLSLAIEYEEFKKTQEKRDGITVQMPLTTVEDDWKKRW